MIVPYIFLKSLGNSSESNNGLCNGNYGSLYLNKSKSADPTHMDNLNNVKKNKNTFIVVLQQPKVLTRRAHTSFFAFFVLFS